MHSRRCSHPTTVLGLAACCLVLSSADTLVLLVLELQVRQRMDHTTATAAVAAGGTTSGTTALIAPRSTTISTSAVVGALTGRQVCVWDESAVSPASLQGREAVKCCCNSNGGLDVPCRIERSVAHGALH